MSEKHPLARGNANEVDAFLSAVASVPQLKPSPRRGRLVFALDATASREPTWAQASRLQARMFEAAAELGGLAVQVCYYQGFDRFDALPWQTSAAALRREMHRIACLSGYTQLDRVLRHTLEEHRRDPVNALVFVGDALEEADAPLYALAGELGLRGIRAFMFQEGDEPAVAAAFRKIARLSGGAYARFDQGSADRLAQLLRAVAAYAAGGIQAMQALARDEGTAIPELASHTQQP